MTSSDQILKFLKFQDMSAKLRSPWQRPLPSNGALYFQQLWASGGRTREPDSSDSHVIKY